MKLDSYLKAYTKINLKGIKDLNITAKVIKLLGKNTRVNLHDVGLRNVFLDMKPKANVTKEK